VLLWLEDTDRLRRSRFELVGDVFRGLFDDSMVLRSVAVSVTFGGVFILFWILASQRSHKPEAFEGRPILRRICRKEDNWPAPQRIYRLVLTPTAMV
jgi:hypothetical protein